MQLKGFKGNVAKSNYKDWIEVDSMHLGGERVVKMTVGHMNDRQYDTLSFDKIRLSKPLDRATNDLFSAMRNGYVFDTAELHICQNDADPTPAARFKLDKVMIAHHHTEILDSSNVIEHVELRFTKVQREYIPRDSANKAQAPHRTA